MTSRGTSRSYKEPCTLNVMTVDVESTRVKRRQTAAPEWTEREELLQDSSSVFRQGYRLSCRPIKGLISPSSFLILIKISIKELGP